MHIFGPVAVATAVAVAVVVVVAMAIAGRQIVAPQSRSRCRNLKWNHLLAAAVFDKFVD